MNNTKLHLEKAALTGAYRYKTIYGLTETGRKKITSDQIGGKYQDTADYICSAYSNPDGGLAVYCIPIDIDVKEGTTDKKWLDGQGRLDWQKTFSFLQKTYPEIFQFTLFIVRSTGGKGVHIGIAVSPFELHLNDGTRKAKFLADQLQKDLFRLLNSEGIGADWSALGVGRDLPNWRRKKPAGYSMAHQLYVNDFVRSRIKREKINVITDLLAVTNKLPGCRVPPKKENNEIIHVHKKTEPGFSRLYIRLFEDLGQSVFMTMSELRKLTGLSKNTLRNVLVSRPESRPKWLKVNHISKSEGYELWLDPDYGSVERAETLASGRFLSEDSGFLRSLPCPTSIEPGQRNTWIFSAIIHYKWHGFDEYEAREAITRQASLIPTYKDSDSYKKLPAMTAQIFGKLPETLGMRSAEPLPEVLSAGYFAKVKKQQQPPACSERSDSLEEASMNVAFTKKDGEKFAVGYWEGEILGAVRVSGTGVIPQLQAIQSLLSGVKIGKVVIRGQSMIEAQVVTDKFASFHKVSLSFEERCQQDKRLLKSFRESGLDNKFQSANPRECFSFPDDIKNLKVRLDGHFEYQKAFYWLGENWIGENLQIHAMGRKIEVFRECELVESFDRLNPGEQTLVERKGPWERALDYDSSYRVKARKVGLSFEAIVLHQIRKGQGVIQTRSIMAYLSLVGQWNFNDLEAAASRCLQVGRFHLSYFKSLLEEISMQDDPGDLEDVRLYLEALKDVASSEEIWSLEQGYMKADAEGRVELLGRIRDMASRAISKKPLKKSKPKAKPAYLEQVLSRYGKTLSQPEEKR